ncbi:MAG TPA: DeoR/GlpR family DNA-binding transcription regulator [Terriglobales bacterium]|nr:DeoR/GlpR family DNA-binding transcription regulator [Terriglobales bacterium]
MLAEERRFQIREVLTAQRTVSAADLCDRLKVTAATIRRDLAALEQEGVLVRSHGGAVSRMSSTNFQPTYDALLRSEHEEKRQIARAAEQLVMDGDTIFLEGSTTVFELARRLAHRHRLTVVSNSPTIVCELQRSTAGVTVMSTGGDLQKDTFCLYGEWTQRALSEIRLDKAILGVSAIDPRYGVSTAHHAEAQITRMVSKAAKTRIALADHTKFGRQRFAFVGPVTDIDILITDSGTDLKHVEQLREAGLQVIIAETERGKLINHAQSSKKVDNRSHTN